MSAEAKSNPGHEPELRVLQAPVDGRGQMTRREMVRAVARSLGAALAYSGVGAAHPICRLLADEDACSRAAAKAAAADWTPEFLNARQNETLLAVAERMVPGSGHAAVNRIIDLLLTVDRPENQRKFLASLSSVDGEAQKRFQAGFPALHAEQQDGILRAFSCAPEKGAPGEANSSGEDPDEEAPAKAGGGMRAEFEYLKGWIVGAYYSSEPGMRELGWTGDVYFESLPGCAHPEGHH